MTHAKVLKAFLILLLLSTVGLALAHATVVLGMLSTEPAIPQAGEPFTLELELEDPTLVPVEDAWVLAEFRPEGETDGGTEAPVTARFEETETPGLYRTSATLPQEGAWELLLRDQTFRQEEATVRLALDVGAPTPPEALSFLFPPTATGSRGIMTWLLWLIGVPVLAGIVVTMLVLSGGKKEQKQQS